MKVKYRASKLLLVAAWSQTRKTGVESHRSARGHLGGGWLSMMRSGRLAARCRPQSNTSSALDVSSA